MIFIVSKEINYHDGKTKLVIMMTLFLNYGFMLSSKFTSVSAQSEKKENYNSTNTTLQTLICLVLDEENVRNSKRKNLPHKIV